MSKLGPKCPYFVWPPLFSSTALTLLCMEFTRASQVATGVLFSSSWWMLETLRSSTFRLRMPQRFSKVVVVLEVVFGVVVVLEYCSAAQSPREGIMLCFSMSQYMLAFMVSSMNCSSPVPAALMQPQTMTLPPTFLTVGKTHLSLYSSPGCHHTRLTPSEPNKFILVSSDHRTWFQ